MVKVNNKKPISNLSKKSFKANKSRNLFAVIAIALTTILFTSLFTMGIGTSQSIQEASMRQAGGDGHAALKYINDDEFNAIKDHSLIKEITYNRILADDVNNEELLKRHSEFWYADDVGLKLGFIDLEKGHVPQKENEVIVDSKTLELLNVPLEIGSPITLELNVKGKNITRDFVLSGWWESDPGFNVGQIFSSRAYVDAHKEELANTYKETHDICGSISAYIMFNNSMNLEEKLSRVINESGFSMNEDDSNYIESNVNWAYLSTNFGMDMESLIAIIGGILLIGLTGYLIIYNIFQISVVRDIKFYGLLKTIGTTRKQISKIITKQALILSALGIPVGLILGFFAGKALVPLLMDNSNFAGSAVSVSPNPIIFIGSALFALITVFISTRKPARIAGKVSPIEAVKYSDTTTLKKSNKNTRGAKVHQMARANMSRNKKRTVLVVLSLCLSVILMNTVFTLSNSLDMNKFVSKFVDTDFLIAHADYFNNDFFGKENETTEQYIQAVQMQDGFEEGGRLYSGRYEAFTVTDKNNTGESKFDQDVNEYGDFYSTACYGLEDLPLDRLELLDGEIDKEKLLSGKYILEGIHLDDNGNPLYDTAHYKVGDKVYLHNYKGAEERVYTDYEFTVMGHVSIKTYTCSDRCYWSYTFYLPAEVYKTLVDEPAVMSYAFNVSDDKEQDFEKFLIDYTDKVEPLMNYDSKQTTVDSFSGMRNTILTVGGALAIIIGFIGILNFINSILTSIITRKQEFAMLQSIGMTRKQLRHMLCFEGIYYSIYTCVLAIVLGVVFAELIVKALCNQLWFMSYNFMVLPLIISIPVLIALGLLIPLISFAFSDKASIVERLREIE